MKNAKNTTVPASDAHDAGANVHCTGRSTIRSTPLNPAHIAKLANAVHTHPANIAPSAAASHLRTISKLRIFKWCWLKHALRKEQPWSAIWHTAADRYANTYEYGGAFSPTKPLMRQYSVTKIRGTSKTGSQNASNASEPA